VFLGGTEVTRRLPRTQAVSFKPPSTYVSARLASRWGWARSVRFTRSFEHRAIRTLGATDVQGAAQLLRISWDQTWDVMERAGTRGRQRKRRRVIRLLGVDEKAVGRGQDYFTGLSHLD
jgi:transposase ISL3 family protein